MVAAVYHGDVYELAAQGLGGFQSAEATTDNHYAWQCRHGS